MSRPIDFTFEKNNFPALSKNSTQSTFILFEARAAYEQVTFLALQPCGEVAKIQPPWVLLKLCNMRKYSRPISHV